MRRQDSFVISNLAKNLARKHIFSGNSCMIFWKKYWQIYGSDIVHTSLHGAKSDDAALELQYFLDRIYEGCCADR
jgi:hypothetical protein